MALREFKKYLNTTCAQYLQMKEDITDFNEAFEKGLITEDKLEEVKEQIAIVEQNYQRLAYAAYLLEIPKRKEKQNKFKSKNKRLTDYFSDCKADSNAVFDENKSALDTLRAELKELTKNAK